MRPILAAVFVLIPLSALAVGGDDDTAPAPTETVERCEDGLVWDLATETCLPPEETTNDDTAMLRDIRSLAYAGRYASALSLLQQMPDQTDPRVLTYYGYVTRKSGDMDGGMAFYAAAIAADPGNLLARSYRGQAYVEFADYDAARDDLAAILAYGGAGTWAADALARTIRTGAGTSY